MSRAASAGVATAVVRVEFNRIAEPECPGGELELASLVTAVERATASSSPTARRALAIQVAARCACCELFPREINEGRLRPDDFEIQEATGSAAAAVTLSPGAHEVLARRLVADLELAVGCDDVAATATAQVRFHPRHVPWFGGWVYHLLPFRRRLALKNLDRVFGGLVPPDRIRRLAHAYYAHLARSMMEMFRRPLMTEKRRREWVRVENMEAPISAHGRGRGLLLLTGHFGNWETATVDALKQFPQYAGKLHFLRRTLKPPWFDRFITWRFRRAGFGTLPKRGSMDTILKLLGEGAIIVFTFDQHAGRPDGIPVEFLGHPAGTFKSLAILALNTGAPVVPACTWREPDGRHVLRFEDPVPLIEHENVGEAIRQNTRAYNAALERMLLRHPEQWIWMHRRWKLAP